MNKFISVLLLIIILFSPVFFLSANSSFYNFLYNKTGVIEDKLLGYHLNSVTNKIIDYIHSKSLDMTYIYKGKNIFNSQELFHMYEVRNIFYFIKLILIFSFIVVLLYLFIKKDLSIFKYQFYYMLGVASIFLVSSLFFTKAFTFFHKLVFDNDYWYFSPKHYLTNILREDFFKYFLIISIILSLIISVTLFFLERYKSGKNIYIKGITRKR